jgi:hypothetical protein
MDGLIAELLERGIIRFDRDEGVYRLCEISKLRPFYGDGVDSAVA